MASLHDLPNELILKIFSYLNAGFWPRYEYECLGLAQLSRRLNTLALNQFFTAHWIYTPATCFRVKTDCGSRRKDDPLSGLAIAFDIKSIEEFSCRLGLAHRYHLPSVFRDYRRLAHILGRLERIGKITIWLDNANHLEPRLTKELETEWRDCLDQLLNVCLAKGCESLTISGGSFLPQYAHMDEPKPSPFVAFQRKVKRLITASELQSKSVSPFTPPAGFQHIPYLQPILLSNSARAGAKLSHLTISSMTLLCPPCFTWTHAVLSTPSLTSLTLQRLFLSTSMWEWVFSCIAHPLSSTLTELTIAFCLGIPPTPLVDCILQLNAITHLKLVNEIPQVPSRLDLTSSNLPTKILPALVSLHAPEDWIRLLCPSIIPRLDLQFLNIILRDPSCFRGNSQGLQSILLNPGLAYPPKSTLNPDIHIALDLSQAGDNPQRHLPRFQNPRSCSGASDRVTELVFPDRIALMLDKVGAFWDFIGWWKNVSCVRIVPDNPDPERFTGLVWMGNMIAVLLKVARVHYPGVKTFIVWGKEYHTYPVPKETRKETEQPNFPEQLSTFYHMHLQNDDM